MCVPGPEEVDGSADDEATTASSLASDPLRTTRLYLVVRKGSLADYEIQPPRPQGIPSGRRGCCSLVLRKGSGRRGYNGLVSLKGSLPDDEATAASSPGRDSSQTTRLQQPRLPEGFPPERRGYAVASSRGNQNQSERVRSVGTSVVKNVIITRPTNDKPTPVITQKRCTPKEAEEKRLEQEAKKRIRAKNQAQKLARQAADDFRKASQRRIMEEVKAEYGLPNSS
ncbi:hypothetical protein PtB15_12B580 [Puccinia triticina]|nr:hypothetical protein PtB15_12B580 [Puccinia triticina]